MTKQKIIINKIVSGGQSGVDRSALDFSIKHKIPHGGWCPRNRWAEDGQIPNIYNLTETTESLPENRTQMNVKDSDATLIIYDNFMDEGTLKTNEFCLQYNKQYLEIDIAQTTDRFLFREWIRSKEIKILNIAGSRESNSPGIYDKTSALLDYLFFG